jgi:signal recognition particle subunit SRP54
MGDVLSLIEQAQKTFDAEQAEAMAKKLMDGEDFTLNDFLAQMQSIKHLGSMKKMLGMLPGAAQMRDQLDNFDEREIKRVEAIVTSMTPQERENPKIINGSRRSRIARGSGVTVAEVNSLLERFGQAKTMMRQMGKRGMGKGAGLPGMGVPGLGMPGLGGGKKSRGRMGSQPKRKKSRSGNPAKRAQELADASNTDKSGKSDGSSFGLGKKRSVDPSDIEIPEGMEKFFGR